jgi:hypothetical protein
MNLQKRAAQAEVKTHTRQQMDLSDSGMAAYLDGVECKG